MISACRIESPNVERTCYIFYYNQNTKRSKCIGTLSEQENDAGEVQYVYKIRQDLISDEELKDIVLSGIDLSTRESEYIRSDGIPYFIGKCLPRRDRSNFKEQLALEKMDYYDPFEFLMRCRNITHHSNCYVGRSATDICDFGRAMVDSDYYASLLANTNEQPENKFHAIAE